MTAVKVSKTIGRYIIPVLSVLIIGTSVSNAQSCGKMNMSGNHKVQKDTCKTMGTMSEDKDEMKMTESCCSKSGSSAATSTSELKAWNAVCPVLGNKVNTEVKTVEYNGKAYGFCCAGCDAKFNADPEKYSKRLSDDGKTLIK